MIVEDQSETLAFLQAWGERDGGQVERIETHISVVLLFKDRVFKLKRAVRLPYLDFSSPSQRLHYCRREVALNRRTAPDLYLGARSITREADGALAIDGSGPLVDAVVEMARFDQDDLLDARARAGPLDGELLDALAANIARFHESAEPHAPASGAAVLDTALKANETAFANVSLGRDRRVRQLLSACRSRRDEAASVLDARGREGRVRRCHGDLHLRNICVIDGRPVPFDCLEFDEELATIDVLYDLAFLLMDLWRSGRPREANRVMNRYIDATRDADALGLLPLFMAMRAAVRAHVAAGRADDAPDAPARATLEGEANQYIDLANALLAPTSPRLVAIGGLSGSGKSTVAAAAAHAIAPPPGARVLSTDRIRKSLFGVSVSDRLPPHAYAAEVSQQVYDAQRDEAARVLQGGLSVIADGVFLRPDERAAIAAAAATAGVPFSGVWLEAASDQLVRRVTERRNDPSDATAEVVRLQLDHDPGPVEWSRIDARSGPGETATAVMRRLNIP